jgi:hypothetical protein
LTDFFKEIKEFCDYYEEELGETLDDFYLLFLNKFEDVAVLIVKSLILGLGCSFEVERLFANKDIRFEYDSNLFSHFLTIFSRLFGIKIVLSFDNGTEKRFICAKEEGRIIIGSIEPIRLHVRSEENQSFLSLLYDGQYFAEFGYEIDGNQSRFMGAGDKSILSTTGEVFIPKDLTSWAQGSSIAEREKYVDKNFMEENYISNTNLFNPYQGYQAELERSSLKNNTRPVDGTPDLSQGHFLLRNENKESEERKDAGMEDRLVPELKSIPDEYEEGESLIGLMKEMTSGPMDFMMETNQEADPFKLKASELEDGRGHLVDNQRAMVEKIQVFPNSLYTTEMQSGPAVQDENYSIPGYHLSQGKGGQAGVGQTSLETKEATEPAKKRVECENPAEVGKPKPKNSLYDQIKLLIREDSFEDSQYKTADLKSKYEADECKYGEISELDKASSVKSRKETSQIISQPFDTLCNEDERSEQRAPLKPKLVQFDSLNPRESSMQQPGAPLTRGQITFGEDTDPIVAHKPGPVNPLAKQITFGQELNTASQVNLEKEEATLGSQDLSKGQIDMSKKSVPSQTGTSELSEQTLMKPEVQKDPTAMTLDEKLKTVSAKSKMKRPTSNNELLRQISATWINRLGQDQNELIDDKIDPPLKPAETPLPNQVSEQKVDSPSKQFSSRKTMMIEMSDSEKPCRICSKITKMTSLYYFDGSFFCNNCYGTLSKRFKKKDVYKCAGCRSNPERILIVKFLLSNKFVRDQGSLTFTKEKRSDKLVAHLSRMAQIPLKTPEFEKLLLLISNNLVTPVSQMAEVKLCQKCILDFETCTKCGFLFLKEELFKVAKCNHAYCTDCLTLIFLKKYLVKKEFTCKASFCWKKTDLAEVYQYLLQVFHKLESEFVNCIQPAQLP